MAAEILMSTAGSRCRKLFETMLRKHQMCNIHSRYEINNYETDQKMRHARTRPYPASQNNRDN